MSRNTTVLAASIMLSAGLSAAPAVAETVAKSMPPLTGRWSGTVREFRDGEIVRHLRLEVSFDGKGRGVLHYPADKCRGRLTLFQAIQGSYTYKERIERGRCRSGAVVSFIPKKGRLVIDREHLMNPVRVILSRPLARMNGTAQ